MKLHYEQNDAIDRVGRFMRSDDQVCYIAGPAGVGKTTIARRIAENVGSGVVFAAPTGKAASVLARKGCVGAKTIHSLFYTPGQRSAARLVELTRRRDELSASLTITPSDRELGRQLATVDRAIVEEKRSVGRPMFSLNLDAEAAHAPLLILDEASMIGQRTGEDLLSLCKKIVVFGDPYQLPPPAESGYFTNRRPDVLLDVVHRQGADSAILDLATRVRQGRAYDLSEYPGCRVIDLQDERCQELCLAADQMIVGKNDTRRMANKKHRHLRGFTAELPQVGDRLLCRKNNHELGLMNGTLWDVVDVDSTVRQDGTVLDLTVRCPDDPDLPDLPVSAFVETLLTGEKPAFLRKDDPECFDFGYAITCHAAQGSEWKKVYVLDQSRVFRKDSQKWLYTAVTRASEDLTVVLP